MERTITKKSDKLYGLIERYKELSKEVASTQEAIEKLENERNKLALQGQKVKDRMTPLADELAKGELSEFETIINIQRAKKEGDVEILIVDRVEQFKDSWRKRALKPVEEKPTETK